LAVEAEETVVQEMRPQAMEFELSETHVEEAEVVADEVGREQTEVLIGEGTGWDQHTLTTRPTPPLEATLADGDEALAPAGPGSFGARAQQLVSSWRSPGTAARARPGFLWAILLALLGLLILCAILIYMVRK
jgi:hypothetical protein